MHPVRYGQLGSCKLRQRLPTYLQFRAEVGRNVYVGHDSEWFLNARKVQRIHAKTEWRADMTRLREGEALSVVIRVVIGGAVILCGGLCLGYDQVNPTIISL